MSNRVNIATGSQGIRARLSQGPVLLSLALGFGQFLGLLRTIGVARYLGTEIQGEAVIIGMITGFFGSVFTLNAAWQLVQSPRYNEANFIASLHASAVIRGIAATILIATASTGVLLFFDRHNLILPMILASLVPTIEGCMNLESWRLIREDRYRQIAAVELSGPICSGVVAILALLVTRSIWVVPIIGIGASLGKVVTSHAVSARLWKPRLHREDVREIVRFGLPLIPAGILFWINTQSDKIVVLVGEESTWMQNFDTRDLGAYGTVAMIVLMPRGTIVKTMQSIVVPKIAATRTDRKLLKRAFQQCWLGVGALSLAIVTVGSVAGQWVLGLALGTEYKAGVEISGILISAMGLQLTRTFCYEVSTGLGTTVTTLAGNLVRLCGIPLAVLAAWQHLGLEGLAWSVFIAEVIACLASGLWLSRTYPAAIWPVFTSVVVLGASGGLVNILMSESL